MNRSVSCLTHERLRHLSANELSPSELEEIEEHVTSLRELPPCLGRF